jgi:signal transduction histidine kinase
MMKSQFNTLRRFNDCLSGASWAFFSLFLIIYPLVLHAGFKVMLISVVVDTLAFGVAQHFTLRIVRERKPYAKFFMPDLDVEGFRALSEPERVRALEELVSFPRFWAGLSFVMTFLKLVPTFGYFVYALYPGLSVGQALARLLVILLLLNSYFVSAIFLESHDLASRLITQLHEKVSLTDIFDQISFPPAREDFEFFEKAAVASIWIFMLSLQILTLFSYRDHSPEFQVFVLVTIGVIGLALASRIATLSRTYFMNGLRRVFSAFETFEPSEQSRQVLALHSSPLLARFERTVNRLSGRLTAYEEEISQWTVRKAEETRYSALGEISGLVVHDLSGPLHVIQFCSEQLGEKKGPEADERYRRQLAASVERASNLVMSLKAYLRNPGKGSESCRFGEPHEDAFRLVRTRFYGEGFELVAFQVEEALRAVEVAIPRAEVIHLLWNLYSNSLQNFITHKNPAPVIRLELVASTDPAMAEILIRDNGTGLHPEQFEQMTTHVFRETRGGTGAKGSLGLRLVRRLVERRGGSLAVDPPAEGATGTVFRLRLRRVTGIDSI